MKIKHQNSVCGEKKYKLNTSGYEDKVYMRACRTEEGVCGAFPDRLHNTACDKSIA